MKYTLNGKVIRNKKLLKRPTLEKVIEHFNKYSPKGITSYTVHNWIFSRYDVTWHEAVELGEQMFP